MQTRKETQTTETDDRRQATVGCSLVENNSRRSLAGEICHRGYFREFHRLWAEVPGQQNTVVQTKSKYKSLCTGCGLPRGPPPRPHYTGTQSTIAIAVPPTTPLSSEALYLLERGHGLVLIMMEPDVLLQVTLLHPPLTT